MKSLLILGLLIVSFSASGIDARTLAKDTEMDTYVLMLIYTSCMLGQLSKTSEIAMNYCDSDRSIRSSFEGKIKAGVVKSFKLEYMVLECVKSLLGKKKIYSYTHDQCVKHSGKFTEKWRLKREEMRLRQKLLEGPSI